MTGIGELQTVAAICELVKVAHATLKFLKDVKEAGQIASEIGHRLKILTGVLEGVEAVLETREKALGDASTQAGDAGVATRIDASIKACSTTVGELRAKIGASNTAGSHTSTSRGLVGSVKIAWRHPTIARISTELEARIQAISTDLAVLQLFEQSRTCSAMNSNHNVVLQAIDHLGIQVCEGNKVLSELMEHRNLSLPDEHRRSVGSSSEWPIEPLELVDETAIKSLSECLQAASDVHERFTSEYTPDVRSVRGRSRGGLPDSPSRAATPVSSRFSPNAQSREMPRENFDSAVEIVMPLYILDRNIQGFIDRSRAERNADHFIQAEENLDQAIKASEDREKHYGIPFTARAFMQEELAVLYHKQKKWAAAVGHVHQLLCNPSPLVGELERAENVSLSQARQHQLLASIYHDRHLIVPGVPLSHASTDIEEAEKHARIAFNLRWEIYGNGERPEDESEQYVAGVQLLVRILELQGKTVESTVLSDLLDSSSIFSESTRRTSTHQSQPVDYYEVVDKHDMLVEAIKARDIEQIQSLLARRDLDLEKLCREGKTFLMHAVEQSDESTVHRLLDPEIGAYVNTANKRGLTALHLAVIRQRHDMVRCLLHHDAEVSPLDLSKQAPITKAVQAGDMTAVQIIFDQDDSALLVKGGDEWSLLHYAVTSKKAGNEMIELLLDLAPELRDAVDVGGKTALHHGVQNERLEHVAALLEHRNHLDVHANDSTSRTPLYLAASYPSTPQRERLVRLLLHHGAAVDERRPPPRRRDYAALRRDGLRRDSMLSRTSVETAGTMGSNSTSTSRLSRLLSRMSTS